MRLILLRHAKAEPFVDEAGDFGRRLEPSGRRRAWATAQALDRLGVRLDIGLVSPSARTVETWEAVQPILGGRMQTVPALYHATPETIMACVAEAAQPDISLAVVGHNPGLQMLALALARSSGAPDEAAAGLKAGFPTASALLLDWPQKTDQPRFLALAVKGRTLTAD